MYSVCVVELQVTVNYTKIVSVVQHTFYVKFISTATITLMQVFL